MATAGEIRAALRKRLEAKAWALFFEVANAAGFGGSRYADAVAMSLWPSRGLEIHGFEFKCRRDDWVKELKDPAKAEAIAKYCDRWWLVIGDAKIVQDGELPPTWGLLTLDGKGSQLRQITAAPKLDPIPLDRKFVACLLRRASDPIAAVDDQALRREYQRGIEEGRQKGRDWFTERRLQRAEELEGLVAKFQQESGVRIDSWEGPEKIGQAVKDVLAGRHRQNEDQVARIREIAGQICERIDAAGLQLSEAE